MAIENALLSGLAGAGTVTFLNETMRRAVPQVAPRMEILGMRAAKAGLEAADIDVPPRRELIKATLGAELVSNSAYYSLVGMVDPEDAVVTGAALGLAAGVGAVLLPGPMGLGEEPSARTPATIAMTIGWYLAGGLAAGMIWKAVGKREM